MTVTPPEQQPDGTRPGGADPSTAGDPDSSQPLTPGQHPPATLDPDSTQPIVGDPDSIQPIVAPAVPDAVAPTDPATGTESATGIEPTTGAPINALPRRVPVRTPSPSRWPAAGSAQEVQPLRDGSRTAVRSAIPEPAAPVDDEPAFWLPIEEVHWDGRPVDPDAAPPPDRSGTGTRAPRRTSRAGRPPRNPVLGLAGLILLSLFASFFAWVSAEPLWLAFGRGTTGTAIVLTCTGSGIGQRCLGEFEADSGAFTIDGVRLAGVDPAHRSGGSVVAARMIDANSGTAYVEAGRATRHLRWLLGLSLVLLCAGGVVWVTGALRLPGGRVRWWGVLTGLAGPLLIAAGFLFAAF